MNNSEIVISGNFFLDVKIIPDSNIKLGFNHKANSKLTNGGILNVSRYLELLKIDHLVSYTVGESNIFHENEKNYEQHAIHKREIRDGSSDLAIILLDKFGKARTSFVIDGVSREHKLNHKLKSKFHHISYLDNLPNYGKESLRILRNDGCLISADLCLNTPSQNEIDKLMDRIQFVDYLIFSESEFQAYFKNFDLKSLFSDKSLQHLKFIIHKKDGFRIIDSDGSKSEIIEVKSIRDVLGAGDCFVAFFLSNVSLGLGLYEIALKTFLETSKFLIKERF
jgi:sugar/nucleoside kinase (ribokinase family)